MMEDYDSYRTVAALREALAERGVVDDSAVELVRRRTAPSRCAMRELGVAASAEAWARAQAPDSDSQTQAALAWAALALDLVGIGGRLGLEGAASVRHPAFAGLPRKQSQSGPAWSAAVQSVWGRQAVPFRLAPTITGAQVGAWDGSSSPHIGLSSLPADGWSEAALGLGLLLSLRLLKDGDPRLDLAWGVLCRCPACVPSAWAAAYGRCAAVLAQRRADASASAVLSDAARATAIDGTYAAVAASAAYDAATAAAGGQR